MRYQDTRGFSFELPDGWHFTALDPLSFFGPYVGVGQLTEVIQMNLNVLPAEYDPPQAREAPSFWGEERAETFRSTLGNEDNVIVLKRSQNNGVSAVHEGVHYNITYSTDSATVKAMNMVTATFQFPPTEQAQKVAMRMRQIDADDKRRSSELKDLAHVRGDLPESPNILGRRTAGLTRSYPKETSRIPGIGFAVTILILLLLWVLASKLFHH